MATIIDSLRTAVPAGREEPAQLGRTRQRRPANLPAYFDRHTFTEPTEAINGCLEARLHHGNAALSF